LAECLARTGIDPKLVGERVIDAIRNRTFYTFVSAVPVDVIKARHRRIEAALETPRSGPPGTSVIPTGPPSSILNSRCDVARHPKRARPRVTL
jgi:hypothetical protein